MFMQTPFGSPSSSSLFMHSLQVSFFRWRRIIALRLGRRGSRPSADRIVLASPHLPVHSRYFLLLFIYLRLFTLACTCFFTVPFSSFDRLPVSSLLPQMASLPISQSTQLTPEEALVHDFDHVSIHTEPQSQPHCLVPLHRGMNVHFRKLSLTKWLKFLYEGIQNYCYHCGKLDHTFNKCSKFLLHCDNHPYPPSLSYKDVLRAPAKSIYKKSIFELSTSIPFEEQPSLANTSHPTHDDHNVHFTAPTTTVVPTSPTASFPSPPVSTHTALTSSIPTLSPPSFTYSSAHCPLPEQTLTTSTTNPATTKGKAPMYPDNPPPNLSHPPLSNLRINDTPSAPSTRKRTFARQNCQVGSSVRTKLL
ncbi:hypothetical protein F8388_005725 [Cannabis sativa]|uniref:CCHC-type domain-containing protein n=1 Tax=Cannabis sativa TaxID=3483 RepID=A0A7J6H6J3_CANSA|nr:hypothetical protein F8388_005725 [Cannabis sativa]